MIWESLKKRAARGHFFQKKSGPLNVGWFGSQELGTEQSPFSCQKRQSGILGYHLVPECAGQTWCIAAIQMICWVMDFTLQKHIFLIE